MVERDKKESEQDRTNNRYKRNGCLSSDQPPGICNDWQHNFTRLCSVPGPSHRTHVLVSVLSFGLFLRAIYKL